MRTIIHVLMLGGMLFMFVQPEMQPSMSQSSTVYRRVYRSASRSINIRSIADGDNDWWQIENFGSPYQLLHLTDRSLRLDALGYPHIAYGGKHLYYTWFDGLDWYIETVDDTTGVGEYTSLVLDGAGYPYISYSGSEGLKFAHKTDASWHTQILYSENTSYTSIALDRDGYARISYISENNHDLMYAYQDEDGWNSLNLDHQVGSSTSLGLGDDGYAHVSYSKGGDLIYTYQDASGWHNLSLDNGNSASLVLDDLGYPHISYQSDNCLKYAYQDATGWNFQTADSDAVVGEATSITLDADGNPYISYWAGYPDYDYKLAVSDGSVWITQWVSMHYGDLGIGNSIAVDNDGDRYLTYGYRGSLYLYNGTYWKIDERGYIGSGTQILDDEGHPHKSFEGYGEIKYAHYDANNWQVETADYYTKSVGSSVDFVGNLRMALDRSGKPHIIYTIRDEPNSLHYLYQGETGWDAETINICGPYCEIQSSNIEVDSGGYPHIVYTEDDVNIPYWGDLSYAFKDASGWHFDIIDSKSYGELKLDEDGYPHIVYVKNNEPDDWGYDLNYTYRDAAGWQTQEVINKTKYLLFNPCLTLDDKSFPHLIIIVNNGSTPDLQYLFLDRSGWHIEPLWGIYPTVPVDLLLDEFGLPHIFYITLGGLIYAYKDEDSWKSQSVRLNDAPVTFSRMYLDEDGNPHICYQDYFGYVMCAHNMGAYEPTYLPLVVR